MKSLLLIAFLLCTYAFSYAQINWNNYNTGYCYDVDGKKHTGLISIDFSNQPGFLSADPDNYIYFKTNDTVKREKIKASAITSFVITSPAEVDSFVVVHSNSHLTTFLNDFFQVILTNAPVKLYCYHSVRQGYTSMQGIGTYFSRTGFTYYFCGVNADRAIEVDDSNYKEAAKELFLNAPPDVITSMQNPKLKFKNFPAMVTAYRNYLTGNSTATSH